MAQLIETEDDLRNNFAEFIQALDDEDSPEGEYHRLLRSALNYVGRNLGDGWQFAPSRYLGHKNALLKWSEVPKSGLHGTYTTRCIEKILGDAQTDTERERQFIEFARQYGVTPHNKARRFWTLSSEGERGPDLDVESDERDGTVTPLNQILFGPPGTGKTFDAVSGAVQIIGGSDDILPGERAKAFDELRKAKQIEFITFHQNYSYEDFIEGIRPVLEQKELAYKLQSGIFKKIAKRAKRNPEARYVLIIDEINRGNIAKIFGELITLIEPSKRLGADDATKVRLPYSRDRFGVPINLYLIGTMNTADRGILLLDAALRRRFAFVPKMPDAKSVNKDIEGVDGQALLTAVNQRIIENLDRDHQIGHTYVMGVDTLKALAHAFQTQIIPLLSEYFYDDWEKMRHVLNDNAFISKRDGAERPVFDVLRYDDPKWRQAEAYHAIYRGNGGVANDE